MFLVSPGDFPLLRASRHASLLVPISPHRLRVDSLLLDHPPKPPSTFQELFIFYEKILLTFQGGAFLSSHHFIPLPSNRLIINWPAPSLGKGCPELLNPV